MARKKCYSKRVFANIRVSSVKKKGGLNIWNGIFIVGLFGTLVHQEIKFLASLSRSIPWPSCRFHLRKLYKQINENIIQKMENQIKKIVEGTYKRLAQG